MKCKFNALISGYIDNQISAKNRASFEDHLKACPLCSDELRIFAAVKQDIKNNKLDSNPEFFWQQVKGRIINEEREKLRQNELVFDFGVWAKRLIPVPVLAAILVVFVIYATPASKNIIDEYLFSNGNGSVLELVEEPGNQLVANILSY